VSPIESVTSQQRLSPGRKYLRSVTKNWQLYLFLLPAVIYIILFAYLPMYGIQLAFKDLSLRAGITASPWTDPWYRHFVAFFESRKFIEVIRNTLTLNLYGLIAGFPIPVLLAILLNELKNLRFRKIVQNITYAPFFISVVVIVGVINLFFSNTGIVNQLLGMVGVEPTQFLMHGRYFPHLFIWSGVWQNMGYSSIIYFAALSGVPAELHEAAIVDGATRLRRIWHINLPHIRPTIVILLILNCAYMLSFGFEKIYLMQNALNIQFSEVISTYIYKLGLQQRNFGMASAVGLFQNLINLVILLVVNWVAKKASDTSLF
jgi:putative aldouronate transport system permease protein